MSRTSLACVALAIAGVLHFVTAPERFMHASAVIGWLYLLLGCFQLVLVVGCVFSQQRAGWLRVMVYSCMGLVLLFILNQVLAGHLVFVVAEPYLPFTLLRKGCELLVVGLLFQISVKRV